MTGTRDAALLALLLAPVAYLTGLAAGPATATVAWPLIPAGVAAAAAAAGATAALAGATARAGERAETAAPDGRRAGGPAVAVVACGGGLAGALLQAASQALGGMPLEAAVPARVGLIAAGMAAGAWLVARRLATDLRSAERFGRAAGGARRAVLPLLVIGCACLAAAGRVQWGGDAPGWAAAASGVAVLAYAALAVLHVQRLHRRALTAGWTRANRAVQPEVLGESRAAAGGVVAGMLVLVVLWLLPALAPARTAVERASPETIERVGAFVGEASLDRDELRREGSAVAGESLPHGEPGSTEDERRVITVRSVVDWLLDPGTGAAGDAALPGDRDASAPWVVPPRLLVALVLLAAAGLLAYLRTRGRQRPSGRPGRLRLLLATVRRALRVLLAGLRRRPVSREAGEAAAREPARPAGQQRPARRWLRPSAPREQIKHDYRRVLELADRHGIPRHRAASPAQYAGVLRPELPGHGDAVDELTSVFVEARYSHHLVGEGAARRSREASRELRRALKKREPAAPR